jgi:hypothetical protein
MIADPNTWSTNKEEILIDNERIENLKRYRNDYQVLEDEVVAHRKRLLEQDALAEKIGDDAGRDFLLSRIRAQDQLAIAYHQCVIRIDSMISRAENGR